MIFLFALMAVAILLGSVFLWLSGYMTAPRTVSGASPVVSDDGALKKLEADNARLRKQLDEAADERKTQVLDDSDKEAEVAKLTSDLAKAEGEKDRAQFEIDNLRDELDAMKAKGKERPSALPKPPPPVPGGGGAMPESAAIDTLQAQLDMEKVTHQKTKDELAQVKKLAAVKMATSPTFSTSGGGDAQGKSRFQTMAFSTRGAGGGGGSNDILKGALDKVQGEKTKLQAELDRAKKEIQILKMRG